MFCENCGKPLTAGAAFCTECGSVVEKKHSTEMPSLPYPDKPVPVAPEPEMVFSEPEYEKPGDPEAEYQPSVFTPAPAVVTLEPIMDSAPEPVSGPYERAGQRHKESLGWSIAKAVLSIFLGIILYALVCAFIALLATRPANIPEVILNTDVVWIMEEIGLDEVILQQVNDTVVNDLNINIYDLEEFLKRSNVADELGKAAEGYIKAITEGNTGYYMSSKEIVGFLKAVAPDIRDQFDYRMTDEDYDFILSSLEDQVDLREFRVERILQEVNVDMAVPGMVLSVYPLIVTAILCALVLFDAFLLHRRKIASAFLTAGIPIVFAGLTYIAAGMLFGFFSNLLGGTALYMITRFTSGIAYMIFTYGLICFAAGVLFVAAYIVIGAIMRKRPAKPPSEKGSNAWLLTGLVTNVALLVVCAAISVLLYNNLL